jgi:chemotaxis family two-component system response regulator Rcp1
MVTEAPSVANQILLLEQSLAEISIIKEAAENLNLNVVAECPEILCFLQRQGKYAQAPRPDLILLDLDLSRSENCEMLSGIKEDPHFRRIPVVVLASSENAHDVFQAYDLHANAYIQKPPVREELVKVLRATLHFWLALVRLPKE